MITDIINSKTKCEKRNLRKFSNRAKRQSSAKVKRTHKKTWDATQGVQYLNRGKFRENTENTWVEIINWIFQQKNKRIPELADPNFSFKKFPFSSKAHHTRWKETQTKHTAKFQNTRGKKGILRFSKRKKKCTQKNRNYMTKTSQQQHWKIMEQCL